MNLLFLHNNQEKKLIDEFYFVSNKNESFEFRESSIFPGVTEMEKDDYSLDNYLHLNLNKVLIKDFDLIIIPYSLSKSNYLGYDGLIIAHHIRFTPSWNNHNTPILFLGQEKPEQVAHLNELGGILFTSGVFTTNKTSANDILTIADWIKSSYGRLSKEQLESAVDRLHIKAPGNYDNRHSVANEWGLFLLGQKTGLKKVENRNVNFRASLKIKLDLLQSSGIEVGEIKPISDFSGSILLVEDDWQNGWWDFYKYIFPNAKVDYLKIEKGNKRNKIFNDFRAIVPEYPSNDIYDLYLIDIRLCDEDKNEKYKEYTGIQILKYLYGKVSRASQVIVTSASDKYYLYDYISTEVFKRNLSFFIKPSKDLTKPFLFKQSFVTQYNKRNKRIPYLEEGWSIIMEIINKAKKQYKNVDRSFYNEIRANLLLGFALFDDGFDNMEYMKYAYLQFYKLIEYISDNEIFLNESDDSHILVKNKNKHITVKRDNVSALFYHEKDRMYKVGEAKYTRRVDTNYKVSALLIFRFGFDTSANWSWININYNRNQKAAHNSNEEMSLNDIIEILRFISKILNDENISSKHADKGIS